MAIALESFRDVTGSSLSEISSIRKINDVFTTERTVHGSGHGCVYACVSEEGRTEGVGRAVREVSDGGR